VTELPPKDISIEIQQAIRSANERLGVLAAAIVPVGFLVSFICECADEACVGRVDMNVGEYSEIHLDRDRYSILRDHQTIEGENLVERRELYDIVSKDGSPSA
jgi:hypothetical protein